MSLLKSYLMLQNNRFTVSFVPELLRDKYSRHRSGLRENSVFNFMFTENGFCRFRFYFIYKSMNFYIYWWHQVNFSSLKIVFVDAFSVFFLSELVNTNQFVFLHELLQNILLWFPILWDFEYNLTLMITHKGVVIFVTATFNWVRMFKKFINTQL